MQRHACQRARRCGVAAVLALLLGARCEAGERFVSLGVFNQEGAATKRLQTLQPRLPNHALQVRAEWRDGQRRYRIVDGPIASDAKAALTNARQIVSDAFLVDVDDSTSDLIPGANAGTDTGGDAGADVTAVVRTSAEPAHASSSTRSATASKGSDVSSLSSLPPLPAMDDRPTPSASLKAYLQTDGISTTAPPGYQLHRLHRDDAGAVTTNDSP